MLTSWHAIKNNLNYSKKKFNIQQPVPSLRFQYKTIGKMQFEMRKMVFLRKRRFLPSNLDRIFQEWQSVIFSIHGRSSSEFLKYFFFILNVQGAACHRSSNSGSHAMYVRLLINVCCTFYLDILCTKKHGTKEKKLQASMIDNNMC